MTYLDRLDARQSDVMAVAQPSRTNQYFRYLVERGAVRRYGLFWETPERQERIEHECHVIEKLGFESYFIMLAQILDFCRQENIPYGPGRGSVGGCYVAWLMGIHEADSIEWGLLFERFLNEDRISYPDVDLDFSQVHRPRVLQFIRDTYEHDDQIVLQVAAFARAGGRSVVDTMLSALGQADPNAGATATNLKKCLPEGNITGGVKIPRELNWWLENGHGDREGFREIAEQAGWLEPMLKIDGMFTHLAKHAAGVVILSKDDLRALPQTGARDQSGNWQMMTGYDMYALDDLGYLKWDILGLRTLDVVADAHRFAGGDGSTEALMRLWREHRDDPEPYELLQESETLGIFQMETQGYRRVLKEYQPDCFGDIVALGALYRPGALDYRREDGKNMVEVFIERRRGREPVTYDHPLLKDTLAETYGIILYQEQQMAAARKLAGFTLKEADELRKAIGKKRPEEMAKLLPKWEEGVRRAGIEPAVANRAWANIEAAARYSWNKSHAWFYGVISWLTVWFKYHHPAAFYAALLNSYDDKKERMADAIAEARQRCELRPPDVNKAMSGFTVDDGAIIFGLNGIKGMGEANRNAIIVERTFSGPFASFEDFSRRLPSVPINMKLALIYCGAFDALEDRTRLLAKITKTNAWNVKLECGCKRTLKEQPADILEVHCNKKEHASAHGIEVEHVHKRWTVAEHLNHNRTLKKPRPLPESVFDYEFPGDTELAAGEVEAMGFYISTMPMADVATALARFSAANTFGGEVESLRTKDDRNGNEMAFITVVTPALTKQRLLMFSSNWPTYETRVTKGARLLFRGRKDGDSVLADACWEIDDVRHVKKIKLHREGEQPKVEDFDGRIETVRELEAFGYRVRLL